MKYVPLIARIFLAALFIVNGITKLLNQEMVMGFMGKMGLPLVEVGIWIAIVIEIVGGLMILFGWKTKIVAWILAAYLLILTLIFHTNFGMQGQQEQLLKNFAAIGGLLLLTYFGGGISCDSHIAKSKTLPPAVM